MERPVSKSEETITQTDPCKGEGLQAGALAVVIEGSGGPNRVRRRPQIGARIKGKILEHAILAILPKPDDWMGAYPHQDGKHVWWYVRGRTDAERADGRFKVVEGWTAASEDGRAFLRRLEMRLACLDTMGTPLCTHLQAGQEAYPDEEVAPSAANSASPAAASVLSRLSEQPGRAVVSVRGNELVVDSGLALDGPRENMNS